MRPALHVRASIVLIGAIGLSVPAPVAATAQQVTITMSADPQNPDFGVPITLHATVTPNGPSGDGSQPHGTVTWYSNCQVWANAVELRHVALAEGETEVTVQILAIHPGEYVLCAEFESADSTAYAGARTSGYGITVGLASSTTTLTGAATSELHGWLDLRGEINNQVMAPDGWISFYRVGDPTPLCTLPIGYDAARVCTIQTNELGTFGYYAVYSGDAWDTGSTSNTLSVTTTAAANATPTAATNATPHAIVTPRASAASSKPASAAPGPPESAGSSVRATEHGMTGQEATILPHSPGNDGPSPAMASTPMGPAAPTASGAGSDLTPMILAVIGTGLLVGIGIRLAAHRLRQRQGAR